MEPLRVLQVCGEPFAGGGQESYLMNMYRHIDRERVQFDFYTPFANRMPAMTAEIEALGGRVWASGHSTAWKGWAMAVKYRLTSLLSMSS